TQARGRRPGTGGLVENLGYGVEPGPGLVRAGERDDRPVAERDQRRVPSTVGHVGDVDPLLRGGVEDRRLRGAVPRVVVVLGPACGEQVTAGQGSLAGAEHVVGDRYRGEGAAVVVPQHRAVGVAVVARWVVAGAGENQHLAGVQQGE